MRTATIMLSMVSPVINGAAAASPQPKAIVRGDADEHVIRDADFVVGHDDRLLHGQRTAIGSILLMITAA